jgi:hypothetical protein
MPECLVVAGINYMFVATVSFFVRTLGPGTRGGPGGAWRFRVTAPPASKVAGLLRQNSASSEATHPALAAHCPSHRLRALDPLAATLGKRSA